MTVTILVGDVFKKLATLPDESIDCAIFSPPYWGLRDYGVAGQIGLEPTLEEHIAVLVSVFREIRRVIKKDGTVWMNYGDVWASSVNGRSAADTKRNRTDDRSFSDKPFSTVQGWFKPKDRIFAGTMLAIALQKDGWWCRDRIIWHKSNCMPGSAKDRCTNSYEEVYLFSKSKRYHFDYKAIREDATYTDHIDKSVAGWASGPEDHSSINHNRGQKVSRKRGTTPRHKNHVENKTLQKRPRPPGRMKRNVWTIATKPFPDAHFATFPPALVEPMILAGCRRGGTILDPFGGAGTTGLVAEALGRNSILIELNPEYAAMARNRIRMALGQVIGEVEDAGDHGPLFGVVDND